MKMSTCQRRIKRKVKEERNNKPVQCWVNQFFKPFGVNPSSPAALSLKTVYPQGPDAILLVGTVTNQATDAFSECQATTKPQLLQFRNIKGFKFKTYFQNTTKGSPSL